MRKEEKENLIRKYMQWCQDCPKAYDFTCSGASAKKCEEEKEKLLKDVDVGKGKE